MGGGDSVRGTVVRLRLHAEHDVGVDRGPRLLTSPARRGRISAGLILLGSAHRVTATLAGWLAVAAGAWFVIGPLVAPLWRSAYLGTPVDDATDASLEQIGMFYGLGAAIVLLAGIAVGRFSIESGNHDYAVTRAGRHGPDGRAGSVERRHRPHRTGPGADGMAGVGAGGSSPTSERRVRGVGGTGADLGGEVSVGRQRP